METPKIFESEYRFCQLLWDREPVGSTELVRLCREKLGWKKSTTYTVIRRLAERGVDTLLRGIVLGVCHPVHEVIPFRLIQGESAARLP